MGVLDSSSYLVTMMENNDFIEFRCNWICKFFLIWKGGIWNHACNEEVVCKCTTLH